MSGTRLAAASVNSLTFAFAEVLGRSYGGGVLELEPTEAEKLPIPIQGSQAIDFAELHELMLAERIDEALDITDRVLLRGALIVNGGGKERRIDITRVPVPSDRGGR